MVKKIIIGSRGSKLALLYAQKAKDKIIEKTNLSKMILKSNLSQQKVIKLKILDCQI